MNRYEKLMLGCLQELKDEYGAISVRAEFETEGTKIEEVLRLKEVTSRAGLGLTVKIGGCESLRDLIEAKIVGVQSLAAPMIESPFAMKKYVQAVNKIYAADELEELEILINLETKTAMQRLDQILAVDEMKNVKSVIFERVDLCYSYGLSADAVNSKQICDIVRNAIVKAKEKNIRTTIGGGVSADSFEFFRSLPKNSLDRVETRKVTFDYNKMMSGNPEKAILAALAFELFYLKNKMSFFKMINVADQYRLDVLEERYWHQINKNFPQNRGNS